MLSEGAAQPAPQPGSLGNDDNFDDVIKESEEELAKIARQGPARSVKDKLLELDEVSLKSPPIENDPTFKKLKMFLRKFTIKADECIQSSTTYLIPEYDLQARLHDSLRNMLREVVHTGDVDRQKVYLTRVYKWFYAKMSAVGAINDDEKRENDEFMFPEKYQEKEQIRQQEIQQKKSLLMDDEYNTKLEMAVFEAGERTIHKDIVPANERIKLYKRRLPNDPNKSVTDISTRPTTKSSTTRVRTAKTRGETVYGQSFRPSFNTFYTTNEEVKYNNLAKVESKSSYLNYVASDHIVEQKLEKMWRNTKNKEVAQKRANEEIQQTLKEWDEAKSRYEEDVQRKNENMWFGSNFTARAFVRKTKPKKIDFTKNHLEDSDGSSLLSDSEIEDNLRQDTLAKEGEGNEEGDRESEIQEQFQSAQPYASTHVQRTSSMASKGVRMAGRQRAQTAGRSKRMPYMPRLIDTSRDQGEKICFPELDPIGFKEQEELNDPKAKPKQEEPPPLPTDYGSIRPKTSEGARRKIGLIRRFQGNLIGATNNHMDMINNVFVASGGQDVVSLSIYNNSNKFTDGVGYSQSATTLPNTKMRPQSAPFKFASDAFAFKRSIRRDTQEELAEIDSLKTKLTKEDVSFKIRTIKKAYEMPAENEFETKKYPQPDAYLMKNPFPKKKKKKKKGKKKKKNK